MICNEADYLQAHLTVIEGKSRGRNLTSHNLKEQVTSVLKKWILAANAKLTAQSNPPLRVRAISASQRFWAGSDLAERPQDAHHPGGTRSLVMSVSLPSSAEPMPPSPNAKSKKNPDTVPILPGTGSCA